MSSPSFPSQETEPAITAQGACQFLERTLAALVADATHLRQLTALRQQLQRNDRKSVEFRQQLMRIERVVSELEDKMLILRDVVKEEQKAVGEIEALAQDTKAKVTQFREIKEKFAQQAVRESSESLPQEGDTSYHEHEDASNQDEEEHDTDHDTSVHIDESETHPHKITLDLVTQDEFMSVPRATRSHISRALVNEAIMDIERTFQEKQKQCLRNKRRRAIYKWKKAPEDEELNCSEQEMRQRCAFFRSGESSARGVLLILRHLNRIKQIPSQNGKIVYVLV